MPSQSKLRQCMIFDINKTIPVCMQKRIQNAFSITKGYRYQWNWSFKLFWVVVVEENIANPDVDFNVLLDFAKVLNMTPIYDNVMLTVVQIQFNKMYSGDYKLLLYPPVPAPPVPPNV